MKLDEFKRFKYIYKKLNEYNKKLKSKLKKIINVLIFVATNIKLKYNNKYILLILKIDNIIFIKLY